MIPTRKPRNRFFLFAQPSFLTGAARITNPFGQLNTYNIAQSGRLADYYALRSDWVAVGNDLRVAIQKHEQLIGTHDD